MPPTNDNTDDRRPETRPPATRCWADTGRSPWLTWLAGHGDQGVEGWVPVADLRLTVWQCKWSTSPSRLIDATEDCPRTGRAPSPDRAPPFYPATALAGTGPSLTVCGFVNDAALRDRLAPRHRPHRRLHRSGPHLAPWPSRRPVRPL